MKLTVAGWPNATLATSLSLNPAFTCRVARSLSVMNPELLLELDDAVVDAPPPPPVPLVPLVDEPELVDEPDDDAPPPDTVEPTDALTAETVPSAGARSVVSFSVFCALATLDCADATDASAAASELGLPCSATCRLMLAESSEFCALVIDCWSVSALALALSCAVTSAFCAFCSAC